MVEGCEVQGLEMVEVEVENGVVPIDFRFPAMAGGCE